MKKVDYFKTTKEKILFLSEMNISKEKIAKELSTTFGYVKLVINRSKFEIKNKPKTLKELNIIMFPKNEVKDIGDAAEFWNPENEIN